MDARTLIDAIEAAGYEARDYSGRGMFGKDCVGLTVPQGGAFKAGAAVAAQLDEEGRGELAELSCSSDAMGRDVIVYFPGVPWVSDEEHSCPHPWHEEGGGDACPRCGSDGQDEESAPAGSCGDCPTCGSLGPQNCGHNG